MKKSKSQMKVQKNSYLKNKSKFIQLKKKKIKFRIYFIKKMNNKNNLIRKFLWNKQMKNLIITNK